MSDLIIPGNRKDGTADAVKYKKDCADFECLPDGTTTRECRYCKWSLDCQQIDYDGSGNVVPMEAHFLPIMDSVTSEIVEHQLFCTGKYDIRPKKERLEDDKVS